MEKESSNQKVAIVGGGLAGLTCAYDLVNFGIDVDIYESSINLGGIAKGYKEEGWDWQADIFYHHLFEGDKAFKKLVQEVGLKNKLKFYGQNTSVFYEGKVLPFSNPMQIMSLPNFSFLGKVKFGFGTGLLRFSPWLRKMDNLKAAETFPKMSGKEGFNLVWKPLLYSKFDEFWDEVSLSWLWARIKSRSFKLGYLDGGFQIFIDKLEEKVKDKGGNVYLSSKVKRINKDNDKWILIGSRFSRDYDQVIFATPFDGSLKLVNKYLTNEERRKYAKIKTLSCLNIVMRLKKPFLEDGTYWLNILNTAFPFVAVVEHTNFVDKKHYNGESIVYVGGYYNPKSEIMKMDKRKVFRKFAPWLRKINLDFERELIDYDLFKAESAQPVMLTGYKDIKPDFKITDGLYWTSQHHIYPWDRGMNFAIENGRKVGKMVMDNIRR